MPAARDPPPLLLPPAEGTWANTCWAGPGWAAADGAVDAAGYVLRALAETGYPFTPKEAGAVLMAMPQVHPVEPLDGAALVNHLADFVGFGGDESGGQSGREAEARKSYFLTRCRWSMLEFLQEAQDIRQRETKPCVTV